MKKTKASPSGFSYRNYFREINVLNDLQMKPQEKRWLAKPPRQPQPTEVVLYLGCNVLRAAHLVQTVTDIFDLLGTEYVAVGGAAYCCGVVYHGNKDYDSAEKFGSSTISHFEQFKPQRVLMWCPSCIYYYDQIMAMQTPFKIRHVSEFLAENLGRLTFTV
ncbi:MAG: heterodisulfide reductase-related iron-sulfur binding cluster, partial [Dehalococcoidia bacterium]